ncbi:MAG TPA: hypothetical protein VJ824_11010 [Bacillota bacterium]|nr:hypothetical protein [Bacillota bacterium]
MGNVNTSSEQPFNYRNFRGAKIIRVIEHLDVAITTLTDQLEFNREINNEMGIKFLEGRIKGLTNAIEILKSEFEIHS